MGKRKAKQESLWVSTEEIARPKGHPFYLKVNEVLEQHKVDQRLEHLCRRFYKPVFGRPSMAPGVYFRLLLIGFFEGIDSERGIAWRVADSLSLREFLGFSVTEQTPDHSTISRTRRLLPVETHKAVFGWFVQVLGEAGLIEGQTIAIDATTLEANAAMRSIRRRDDGRGYEEYPERSGSSGGPGESHPGATGANGPEAQEERIEPGVDESGGCRCAHHQDEGWPDAPGA